MARKNVIQFSIEVVDKVSKRLDQMAKTFIKFGKRVAIGVAGIATAFAIATKRAIGFADQIGKTAKVVGLSAEALQELRFAAQQTGVATLGLDDSIRRMQRRLGEFINSGAGPAQKAIEKLNISITDAAGQFVGTEQAFFRVVDAMQQLETVAERSAIAAQLFGDDFGPKLVTLTDKGVAGIQALRQEARDLGLVIDNEAVAASERAQDEFGKLAGLIQTRVVKAFADNAEAIKTATTLMIDLAIEIFNVIDTFAKFTGLAEKGIKDLEKDNAALLLTVNELVRNLGDEARFTAGFIAAEAQIAANIERIRELIRLQDLAGVQGPTPSGGPNRLAQEAEAQAARLEAAIARFNKQFALERSWIEARERVEEYVDSLDIVLEEQDKAAAELARTAQDIGLTFASAFEDAVVAGKKLRGVLQGLLQDLIRLATRKLLTEPLTGFFGGVLDKISGRSAGGPAEGLTRVGERGSELINLPRGSRVANSSATKAASRGAGGMQFITYIDAKGADPGLIARLPAFMEQRDRRLMLKVKEYFETGAITI